MTVREWGGFALHEGDCVEIMRTMAECSVDSIVTDPPYGIRFMGKAWDGADIEKRHAARASQPSKDPSCSERGAHNSVAAEAGKYDLSPAGMLAFQQFSAAWAREALRTLKPGGYLLSFASTRTYHRMVCGLEEAGFEIRDQIGWAFGSGFPKSHNGEWGGTALKPAWEPICLARKPLVGTVEANWRKHGTGALSIDACRVPGEKPDTTRGAGGQHGRLNPMGAQGRILDDGRGRWPANLIHDGSDEVVAAFPDAPGQLADVSRTAPSPKTSNVYGRMNREGEPSADSENSGRVGFKIKPGARRLDTGSAARFFYCAKASVRDRDEGLGGMPARQAGSLNMRNDAHAERNGKLPTARSNTHPTVKPTDLMRYLCRLVTPAGGLVLDPFTGSGSTGKAAVLEGFRFVGIELSSEYLGLAERRIAEAWMPGVFGVAA